MHRRWRTPRGSMLAAGDPHHKSPVGRAAVMRESLTDLHGRSAMMCVRPRRAGEGVDGMTSGLGNGTALDHAALDGVLDELLSRTGAIVVALTDGAVRTSLPDDPRFAAVRTLPG